MNVNEIMLRAREKQLAIPALNVAHLPMAKPIMQALIDTNTFALIEAALVDWTHFGAGSLEAVCNEYDKYKSEKHVRLHLDHIPVIDEKQNKRDYMSIIKRAIECGYNSVMVDGSIVSLDENIQATAEVVEYAHQHGVVVEAELGAVYGHAEGPIPPYEELFSSGQGFTDLKEASLFVEKTGCDWLSVAVGNIHGAISGAGLNKKKLEARINLDHLNALNRQLNMPLVLHGGTGINLDYVRKAFTMGITKLNIGTEIRQLYELNLEKTGSIEKTQDMLYERVRSIIVDDLKIEGTSRILCN